MSKLIYAALEATLEAYAASDAVTQIPVLKMLAVPPDELEERTRKFAETLVRTGGEYLRVELINGESVVGGGAAPDFHPATSLIALRSVIHTAASLERKLRIGETPVITRLQNDQVLIDLRTVGSREEDELLAAVSAAAGK